jgi:hypothetical protein
MRMGKALSQAGYREKVFLMTKIDGRGKEKATRQIETSLERLRIALKNGGSKFLRASEIGFHG